MSEKETIFVVDDDPEVRDSVAFLLECSEYSVVSFASASAFLEYALTPLAGCIVSDIRMPGIDGLEMQRRLSERGVNLPIIFITGHGDVPIAVQALKRGAANFIEKPFEEQTLLNAIRDALSDGRANRQRSAAKAEIESRIGRLTPREREVLTEMAVGHPNKVIAHRLDMSARTVEVHRARVMEKMQVRHLSELLRLVRDIECLGNQGT